MLLSSLASTSARARLANAGHPDRKDHGGMRRLDPGAMPGDGARQHAERTVLAEHMLLEPLEEVAFLDVHGAVGLLQPLAHSREVSRRRAAHGLAADQPTLDPRTEPGKRGEVLLARRKPISDIDEFPGIADPALDMQGRVAGGGIDGESDVRGRWRAAHRHCHAAEAHAAHARTLLEIGPASVATVDELVHGIVGLEVVRDDLRNAHGVVSLRHHARVREGADARTQVAMAPTIGARLVARGGILGILRQPHHLVEGETRAVGAGEHLVEDLETKDVGDVGIHADLHEVALADARKQAAPALVRGAVVQQRQRHEAL